MGIAATIAAVGGVLALVDPIITIVMTGTIGGTLLIVGLIILAVGGVRRHRILTSMPQD